MDTHELSKKKWLNQYFSGVASVALAGHGHKAFMLNAFEITRHVRLDGKFTTPQPIFGVGDTEETSYSALFDRVAVDMVSRGKFVCVGLPKQTQNFSIIPGLEYEMIEHEDKRHSHSDPTLFDFSMVSVDDDQSVTAYDFDFIHCHLLDPSDHL